MKYLFQLLLPLLLPVFIGKPMSGQAVDMATAIASIPGPAVVVNAGVPAEMSELMQASREKFLKGYDLIQNDDIDAARASFDAAVDMVLSSGWIISQTPHLDGFFKELTRHIRDVESDYLFSLYDDDDWEVEEGEDVPGAEAFLDLDLNVGLDDPAMRIALSSALRQGNFDIPIDVNDHVAKTLEYFLNRGRQYFEDALVRSGLYRPLIEQIFREEELPLDLINLALVESAFKPQAVSRARARGLWQFIQGTGARYGLKVTSDIDERSDPEKSTRAAAHYLKELYEIFGDWNLVLAAYNWGEGNVKRLIERTGVTDFWKLADMPRRMPAETRRHVPLILASAILSHNPEKYGFTAEFEKPLSYNTIAVSKPVDLGLVAKTLNTHVDEIRKLNPAIKGSRTPARYPDFALKVPADCDPELYALIEKLPEAPAIAVEGKHKVEKGDTLSALALRYGVRLADLQEANNHTAKSILRIGMMLDIPVRKKKKK
jgi:membrane-bound lytic murein transglycosylase D